MKSNHSKILALTLSALVVNHVSAADKSSSANSMQIDQNVMAKVMSDRTRPAFIDPGLMMLMEQHKANTAPGQQKSANAAKPRSATGLPEFNARVPAPINGMIKIEALAKDKDAALIAQLTAAGAQNITQAGNLIYATMPLANLDRMLGMTTARFVRQTIPPITHSGPVNSQGDAGQRSNIARQNFGVTGNGSHVGILSDSWNSLGTADKGVAAGELPGPGNPNGYGAPVDVLKEGPAGSSDEGRGMGEIVHDIAPGARLSFYAPENYFDHAEGIRKLAKAGATAIVDDIFWFGEPWYQPSPISIAARDVGLRNNIVVLSSAGNHADNSYEGSFKPTATKDLILDGQVAGQWQLHDFGGGGVTAPLSLLANVGITFVLQWDEAFASVSPKGVGSTSDLDILFFSDPQGTNLVFKQNASVLGGDALEIIGGFGFTSTDPNEIANLYVGIGRPAESTGTPKKFKLAALNNGAPIRLDKNLFNKATALGHSGSEWIISSCAVRYNQINNGTLAVPENFSSTGGFARTRDENGNQLPYPIQPIKPDVCSPDNANTSFFGRDNDGDGLPNFGGTSASAPHAAGIAALMQEASGMNLPAFAIGPIMRITATDMNDPRTPNFDFGYDAKTGFGFLFADKALEVARYFRTPKFFNRDK